MAPKVSDSRFHRIVNSFERLSVRESKETRKFSVILLPGVSRSGSIGLRWGVIYVAITIAIAGLCLVSNFVFALYPSRINEYNLLVKTGTGRLTRLLGQQIAYTNAELRVYAETSELMLGVEKDFQKSDDEVRNSFMITPQYETIENLQSMNIPKESGRSTDTSAKLIAINKMAKNNIIDAKKAADMFVNVNQLAQHSKWLIDHSPNTWPASDCDKRDHSPRFGWRIHPITGLWNWHEGIDIEAKLGEPIQACADGTVTRADWRIWGLGKCVEILHRKDSGGLATVYGHCDELLVKAGQEVKKGDIIAYVGSTGNSTGPHIHFEVRVENKPVDPDVFIRTIEQRIGRSREPEKTK